MGRSSEISGQKIENVGKPISFKEIKFIKDYAMLFIAREERKWRCKERRGAVR